MAPSFPIVFIEWRDPKQQHGWTSKLAEDCANIKTVGFLIKSDASGSTVVESVADDIDEPWGCSTFIPNHLISKIEHLTGCEVRCVCGHLVIEHDELGCRPYIYNPAAGLLAEPCPCTWTKNTMTVAE